MIKKLKKNPKLKKSIDRTYQFKICLWIALRKTTGQIRGLLKERLNVSMSYQNIDHNYRYAKKWQKIITYLRTRYLNNISRIPIANKAYRLALLDEAALEATIWRTKSINQYGKIKEKKIGLLPAIAREARTEIEGERPGLVIHNEKTVFQDIRIEGQPAEKLAQDINSRLANQFNRIK